MRIHLLAAAATAAIVLTAAPVRATDFESLGPSIVRVVSFQNSDFQGMGSGIVVANDGHGSYIVTNFHVVKDASRDGIRIVAPTPGGGGEDQHVVIKQATYQRGAPDQDFAILYVPDFVRQPLPISTAAVHQDAGVRAMGYPFTDLTQWQRLQETPTLTGGLISTTADAPWPGQGVNVHQIQHTASLNEGMSGGPLLDLCGRVIGIDTARNRVAQNTYLSLAFSDVIPMLNELNIHPTMDSRQCVDGKIAGAATPQVGQAGGLPAPAPTPWWKQPVTWIAGVLVLALAGAAALFAMRRSPAPAGQGAAAPTPTPAPTPSPSTPPHGLLLRAVSEEVRGKDRIIRQADLAGTLGVEIGRNAGFGGEQTSRRHARVKWDGKSFVLCDLDSLNGTKINGREIKGLGDQPIAIGDQITFGARDALYQVDQL